MAFNADAATHAAVRRGPLLVVGLEGKPAASGRRTAMAGAGAYQCRSRAPPQTKAVRRYTARSTSARSCQVAGASRLCCPARPARPRRDYPPWPLPPRRCVPSSPPARPKRCAPLLAAGSAPASAPTATRWCGSAAERTAAGRAARAAPADARRWTRCGAWRRDAVAVPAGRTAAPGGCTRSCSRSASMPGAALDGSDAAEPCRAARACALALAARAPRCATNSSACAPRSTSANGSTAPRAC